MKNIFRNSKYLLAFFFICPLALFANDKSLRQQDDSFSKDLQAHSSARSLPDIKNEKENFNNAEASDSFNISGEVLYFKPLKGVYHRNNKYKSGFRIGIGKESIFNKFDFSTFWTHYDNSLHETRYNNYGFRYNKIDCLSQLRIDTLEGNIGKSFSVFSNLTFKPLFGLEWAQFERNYGCYGDQTFFKSPYSSSFKGLGPQIGLDISQQIFSHLNLCLSGTQSMVFGNIKKRVWGKLRQACPISKLGIKAEFEIPFEKSKTTIHLSSGYEIQYWRKEYFKTGDFLLSGFNLQARLEF